MNQQSSSTNPLRRIYYWTLSLAERKLVGLWLALLSFAEASFFPFLGCPLDPSLPWQNEKKLFASH